MDIDELITRAADAAREQKFCELMLTHLTNGVTPTPPPNEDNGDGELLTLGEVATMCRRSKGTIARWRRHGKLPAAKGHTDLFRKSTVLRVLGERKP